MSTKVTVDDSGAHRDLHVLYDGSRPPLELFSAWAELGWLAPTPATPPREAIDWGTPDPRSGRSYSLRSWSATGTATLTQHSPDDDARLAGALDAARRLGCEVVDPPGAEDGLVHITAVLLAHSAPSLVDGVRARGGSVRTRDISISRTVRYRGSTNEIETPAVEVEIDITERQADAVVSALAPHATTAPQVTRPY